MQPPHQKGPLRNSKGTSSIREGSKGASTRNWEEFYSMLNRSLPRFNETLQLPFNDTNAMEALEIKRIEPPIKRRKI